MMTRRPDPPDHADGFRQLLIADLALMRALVQPHEVATALMRAWSPTGRGPASLVEELLRLAGLDGDAFGDVVREADRLIQAAGGDADTALTRRGGLDRSIHLALGEQDVDVSQMLTRLGTPTRTPLRRPPSNRYVDFEVVGAGGMGIVYLALDTELNRRVAFKIVRPAAATGESDQDLTTPAGASLPGKDTPASAAFELLKARFLQEAWVTGGLEHPGIVPVYELGETARGIPYYTMRFVRGKHTLADALVEMQGSPFDRRLILLEPFLKLCDTVRYAHSKDIVHRDLKPDNVALGEFGEVVLLDWGLAKVEGREDPIAGHWQERIREFRRVNDMRTLAGGILGTPGYMAPEAAHGQVAEVGRRSDVYSLGVILFQVLTGRMPFPSGTYGEFVSQVTSRDAPAPREVSPDVPEVLSALCSRALSRDKSRRPASAEALAAAVRTWQAASAVEREVQGLLRDASAALEAAESASAEVRLQQVDRAAAVLRRVEAKQGASQAISRQMRRTADLRELGLREREQASGRRLLARIGVIALVLFAFGALGAATLIDQQRTAKEQALVQVREEKHAKTVALEAKSKALDDVLRLAESKLVRDLVDELDRLWPVHPDRAGEMAEWVEQTGAVLRNGPDHERRLARLRKRALPYHDEQRQLDHAEELARVEALRVQLERSNDELQDLPADGAAETAGRRTALEAAARAARSTIETLTERIAERRTWKFSDAREDWMHQVLTDLLSGLQSLRDSLPDVGRRHRLASTLRQRSVEDHAETWSETVQQIATSERYGRLRLVPQLGLVPLGPDPDSGLFEFAHVGSGSIPRRDRETERLVYEDDAAIVLVLLPGATYRMGAQHEYPNGPNYDPLGGGDEVYPNELPVQVTLPPFFIAKHECTQAQWMALTGGVNPSDLSAGERFGREGDEPVTLRNPVEQVSWEECARWLSRWNLALPTEARWEYACRAGTTTPRFTGREVASLQGFANIADAHHKACSPDSSWDHTLEVDDGHSIHAPVGTYQPNAFGLHDTHGNVWEWCRDAYDMYPAEAAYDPVREVGHSRRILRGASWSDKDARSADRFGLQPGDHRYTVGVRPARSITTD